MAVSLRERLCIKSGSVKEVSRFVDKNNGLSAIFPLFDHQIWLDKGINGGG
jgi:hypothetical protein